MKNYFLNFRWQDRSWAVVRGRRFVHSLENLEMQLT